MRQEQSAKQRHPGAFGDLMEILEDAKTRNKPQVWRNYFLSERFLRDQWTDAFGKNLQRYLGVQEGRERQDLPQTFVTELMIAYGIMPDGNGWADVSGSFPARRAAGMIWNARFASWQYHMRLDHMRTLLRPENRVRLRSFSDYLALRELQSQGRLTGKEREIWESLLEGAASTFLYEISNDFIQKATNRSVCLVKLLTFWVETEPVPGCVCQYMYQKYGLGSLKTDENIALYQGLRDGVLARYPLIEKELGQEKTKWQQDSQLLETAESDTKKKGFWEYFLSTAFCGRLAPEPEGLFRDLREYWEELPNVRDSVAAYLEDIQRPSSQNRLFSGWDQEKGEAGNQERQICLLPDGRILQAEFHLHVVRWFLNDCLVKEPVISFSELQGFCSQLSGPQDFFFLLAVSGICEEERKNAVDLVLNYLQKLALENVSLPVLASAMVEDRICVTNMELLRNSSLYYAENDQQSFLAAASAEDLRFFSHTPWGWRELILSAEEEEEAEALEIQEVEGFVRDKLKSLCLEASPQGRVFTGPKFS
ncbi:MAG: hypothetical protein HFI30_04080 [Lachnospiraceae bacterium]|jgi:hypothetical protein|nr:hypothetical protein [Lachnospiraceae bacterium]